jgi:DNA polymerase III delta prime subunit
MSEPTASEPQRLILIGGPPGVGKSTVARILFGRLRDLAWLDGDDVWRITPFETNASTKALVERNIRTVIENYLAAGYRNVMLSWVMHRQDLIERLIIGVPDHVEIVAFTLLADNYVLEQRIESDRRRPIPPRKPREFHDVERLLNTIPIDTTDITPREVADQIIHRLHLRHGIDAIESVES